MHPFQEPTMDSRRKDFEKNKFDVDSTCRSCLASSNDVKSLFDLDAALLEQMWECAEVRILSDDGLPAGLCSKCMTQLRNAHAFRTRCKQSDARLRHFKHEYGEMELKNVPVLQRAVAEKSSDVPVDYDCPDIKVEYDFKFEDALSTNSGDEEDLKTNMDKKKSKSDSVDKKFKCPICTKPLKSKHSLEYHMKNVHRSNKSLGIVTGWGSERRIACTECPFTCKRSTGIKVHMRIHTGEKPYECDACGKCFNQYSTLAHHRTTHSDVKSFTCERCGKQFKSKGNYLRHKAKHSPAKKTYVCDICDNALLSKATLVAHLNRHGNVKNFRCETCGAAFVSNTELLGHAKKHDPVKRHACHLCAFRARYPSNLKKHLARHAGTKSFECELCDYSCYDKHTLACHRKKHTKEKAYACPVCALKYAHSPSVNKHMLKAHGIKYNRLGVVDRTKVKRAESVKVLPADSVPVEVCAS